MSGAAAMQAPDQPCQGVLTEENGRGAFRLLSLKRWKRDGYATAGDGAQPRTEIKGGC